MTTTDSYDDEIRMLREGADALFSDHVTPALRQAAEAGTFPSAFWDAVCAMGLPLAAVREEAGGAGMPLGVALGVCFEAGRHALPLPLGEAIVAHWLLDRAGLPMPQGLVVTGLLEADGSAQQVPWGRHAGQVALLTTAPTTGLALVRTSDCHITPGHDIAGEARDAVKPDPGKAMTVPLSAHDLKTATHALAVVRSQQMAGAMSQVVQMSTRYAGERVQFGRPLAKLQVIQQYLAVMAGQAASARAAADLGCEGVQSSDEAVATATAKIRCSEASGVVAKHAHQIHGAMGFTHEHPLHWFTRRLWAWRDEHGNESVWARRLIDSLGDADAGTLWQRLPTPSRATPATTPCN
jgi:alkylation response protein AidB-like acyl-CoA dehydrogenase